MLSNHIWHQMDVQSNSGVSLHSAALSCYHSLTPLRVGICFPFYSEVGANSSSQHEGYFSFRNTPVFRFILPFFGFFSKKKLNLPGDDTSEFIQFHNGFFPHFFLMTAYYIGTFVF